MDTQQVQRISAAENPAAAQAVAEAFLSAEAAVADEPFEPVFIQRPPDCSVVLPGGLLDMDGNVVTDAEVWELTGEDEEALAKADATKNIGRFISTLLKRGVVRIGEEEPVSKGTLDSLLIGDRDMLLLAIRKATYGHEMEYGTRCPYCFEQLEAVIDLNTDVPIKKMDEPKHSYEVPLRNDKKAVVRLAQGEDQDKILSLVGKSVPEMNTALLGSCVLTIDGNPTQGAASVRALGMQDRKTLLDFITAEQPGPKYEEVKINCPACEREVSLDIDLGVLFRG